MKQQFLKDSAGNFQTYIVQNNRNITPTSPTLTVYKPGSSEKLVDAQAMDTGSDGLLSYALTAGNNVDLSENYKAVVTYTFKSVIYSFVLFYDVVNSILHQVITDDDISSELPQLKELNWRVHGTADSGSPTTIIDAELKRYADDYFTGGLAYSIDKDETREITDFVASTGTVTTTAFSTGISTDKYVLMRSFTKETTRAFEKLEEKLKARGRRAHLILDPYDLREVHLYFTVADICKGLVTDEDSFWWALWQEYKDLANETFNSLSLKYDVSNDGTLSGSELGKRMSSIKTRFV